MAMSQGGTKERMQVTGEMKNSKMNSQNVYENVSVIADLESKTDLTLDNRTNSDKSCHVLENESTFQNGESYKNSSVFS